MPGTISGEQSCGGGGGWHLVFRTSFLGLVFVLDQSKVLLMQYGATLAPPPLSSDSDLSWISAPPSTQAMWERARALY
jgi:hypothetical protein